jgi:CRP-like cAMP-binding protein
MIKTPAIKELEEIKAVLSSNPLFAGLDGFYLKDLANVGEVRQWPKDSQIILEGDYGDAVYFILSGRAKVTLYGEEGREIVLSVLSDGDMFGEMALLDDKPRSANVESIYELRCFVVERDEFLNYLKSHHKIYTKLLAYFTSRLREATRKIGGLALLDVCGRIAHTLLGMSKEKGEDTGGVIAVERPTHEELAALIGSSREVVSRALKKMTTEGYIKIEKDKIILYLES